jgi:MerR family transcriptional regulator/heat shock protein HspR
MISVAASLAGVHPQTLRIYEERHLIQPTRTPKGTRLYSDEDVETLRRIMELTDEGMNLAGVQRVFEMEAQLARMARRIRSLETQLEQTRAEALAEIDRVRRAGRAEIVRYQAPQPVPIPIQRSPTKREYSDKKEA